MPFEDFYKAADQHAHRWRLCLIAAIFFIAAYFSLPFFVKRLLTPPPEVKSAQTETVRGKADALCMSLPKPEQFFLTGVGEEKIADGAAKVEYRYRSQRSFEEIMPPYLIWFDEQGWERIFDEAYARKGFADQVFNFRNGNRRVSVLYFNLQKNNSQTAGAYYEIVCTVEKKL